MVKIFRYPICFKAIYFKNIVIVKTVSTKDHNRSEVSLLSSRVGEVDRGTDVKTFSFEEPVVVSFGEIVLIVVLEQVSLDGGIIHVVWVVVVLGSKVNFVKVLRSFSRKNIRVEAKPFTIGSTLSRPEKLSGTISGGFDWIFFAFKKRNGSFFVSFVIVFIYFHF